MSAATTADPTVSTTSVARSTWTVVIGAIVGALVGLILTAGVALRSGDQSTLIHFAPPDTQPDAAPPGVVVLPAHRGYDGQFYFRLARAPFSTAEHVDGVRLDHPALRMSRIGYPVAARLLSETTPLGLVSSMLAVNVACYALIGASGVLLARRAGHHERLRPLIGLSLVFVPAFIYGTSMSVTDTMSGAFVLLGWWLVLTRRTAAAAASLSIAVLTRETALLVPVALMITSMIDALRSRRTGASRGDRDGGHLLLAGLVPLGVFAVWQVIVYATWGGIGPLESGSRNLTLPFLGPVVTSGLLRPATSEGVMNLLVPGAALVVVALAVLALVRRECARCPLPVVIAFAIAVVAALSIGPAILATYRSSVRAIGDATTLAVLVALFGRGWWTRATLVGIVVLGAVLITWELRIASDIA